MELWQNGACFFPGKPDLSRHHTPGSRSLTGCRVLFGSKTSGTVKKTVKAGGRRIIPDSGDTGLHGTLNANRVWKQGSLAGSSHGNLDGPDPGRDEEGRMESGIDQRKYASETGDMMIFR